MNKSYSYDSFLYGVVYYPEQWPEASLGEGSCAYCRDRHERGSDGRGGMEHLGTCRRALRVCFV